MNEVTKITMTVAKRYKRRWSCADVEDMAQEASVAVLRARKTFDPSYGVKFATYGHRAAEKSLWYYLWRQSLPVHASIHKIRELKGIVTIPVTDSTKIYADSDLEHDLWRKQLRERLSELLAKRKCPEIIQAVLLEGKTAKELGGDARQIYRITCEARAALKSDKRLRRMWEDGQYD